MSQACRCSGFRSACFPLTAAGARVSLPRRSSRTQRTGDCSSMSLNISRFQNLQNGNISEVLPSISFNHSQSYPLRFGKTSSDISEGSWYEQIGLSYNASLSNNRAKTSITVESIKENVGGTDT